jgi:hypothetical protein
VDEVTFREVCDDIADNCFYDFEPFRKVRLLARYGIEVENQF